jgi:hypothetical protein
MRFLSRLALVVPALVACGDHDHNNNNNNNNNPQTMAVVVDTGQTMTPPSAAGFGGQGIGLFVEYKAGGHWHVYWACDTSLSGSPCTFDVTMSVADSSIANAASTQFVGNDAMTTTPAAVTANTFTTTQVDTVDFDATPGAAMTVDVSIAGLGRDWRWFFFVQNGQVNGNYQGTLTDPLRFEPSSP